MCVAEVSYSLDPPYSRPFPSTASLSDPGSWVSIRDSNYLSRASLDVDHWFVAVLRNLMALSLVLLSVVDA
jgi:hypothetical protein